MKLLFTFIFSLLLFPQHNAEKILWKENQKLSWEDFRGKPLRSASFVASTNTGISFQYSYSMKNGDMKVEYSVESFFNPEGSWYLKERVTNYILKHEQAHFDISELHARMLQKNLAGKKFSKNIKSEIEGIYKQVEQKRRAMQTKFDSESDHSRNEAKEAFWQKYIAQQLAEYESWK
ncbi:DUF922 domain-containing protein [Aequorivita lipolytica]|uniref:DUF922 domain-containing protein n=1 Tax=Aequorivita lipolytica TaxID=153267 RepID=A0A5C6YMN5_9FLAO|nr:DUF922 domain-containing protein [Aequorivita lipolytica]TXD68126.1 DUF922 domain-containing protein [Aequorivita lipolytica]SRX53552.1 hypothetical protein AEQU2_02784 [Aequorivita lipolytica]